MSHIAPDQPTQRGGGCLRGHTVIQGTKTSKKWDLNFHEARQHQAGQLYVNIIENTHLNLC